MVKIERRETDKTRLKLVVSTIRLKLLRLCKKYFMENVIFAKTKKLLRGKSNI